MDEQKADGKSRLIDYIAIVGVKSPNGKSKQDPGLLYRFVE